MTRTLAVPGVLALLTGLGVVSVRSGDPTERPEAYVERAAPRPIVQVVKASGLVDAKVKVHISTHVIGRVQELYVEEGDDVRKGQPLLDLEKEAFLATRDRARMQVEIARLQERQGAIDRDDAAARLRRIESLAGERIVSQEQVEAAVLRMRSAEVAYDQARERLRQAEVDLAKADDDLAKSTLYSPLSGTIVKLFARPGEVVVSGTLNNAASVIGTIADLSRLIVESDVDEREVAEVAVGQPAEVDVDALPGRTLHGRVTEIGASGAARPGRADVTVFPVEVLLEERESALRPGMSVRTRIRTASESAEVAVPVQAVVQRAAKTSATPGPGGDGAADEVPCVFVLAGESARLRAVTVGLSDATYIQIRGGLARGETVVTGPYRVLKDLADGDRVRVASDGRGEP